MLYNIPPRNSYGKDTFAYWDGFLSDEEIDYLLNVPEWANAEDAAVSKSNGNSEKVINKEIRKTNVAWLGVSQENQKIWRSFSNVVAEVNRRFFRFDLTGFYEPLQLGLYHFNDAGHYDWHIDASPEDSLVPRKLSVVVMLSDPNDFEGGNLQLKNKSDEPVTLEQKKGRAWFFPSYVLHRVTPVTKGIRKSAVLWVGGPEFR